MASHEPALAASPMLVRQRRSVGASVLWQEMKEEESSKRGSKRGYADVDELEDSQASPHNHHRRRAVYQ